MALSPNLKRQKPCELHSAEWHLRRTKRFCASEIPSILGCGYESRIKVFRRKAGLGSPSQMNDDIRRGLNNEKFAFERYEVERINKGEELTVPSPTQHPRYSWISATPDFIVWKGDTMVRLGEIKCPRDFYDNVPLKHWIQMQVQMEVFDMDESDFVEFVGTRDQNVMRSRRILRDRNFWDTVIFPALEFAAMTAMGVKTRYFQDHVPEWCAGALQ